MSTKTVLIVDDEEGFQVVLEIILRRAGYETLVASNGKEGLEMVYEHCPDLVILDNQMPEMSGSEVCQKIKTDPRTRNICAIMHSATLNWNHPTHWQHIGADAFLPKPSTRLDILRTVQILLM